MEEYTKLEACKQLQKRVMEATEREQDLKKLLKEVIIAFRFKEDLSQKNVHNDFNRSIEEKEEKFNTKFDRVANQKIMENIEQLVTMLSNILDAIKEGQKASQEVAKQVEELAQLRSSDIMFQSQRDDTCKTLAELAEEFTFNGMRNVLLFRDGTLLVGRCLYDLQTLLENAKTSTITYTVWKQL